MAQRGWYSDPGGEPGMYRYWDGTTWSDALSPTPSAPPPTFAYTPMYGQPAGYGQQGAGSQGGYGQGAYPSGGGANAYSAYQDYQEVKTKRSVGPWIILGVVAVALIVLIALVIRSFIGSTGGGETGGYTAPPTSNSTELTDCPRTDETINERADHPNDGRVHGGQLSYPMLGSPWGPVEEDDGRIPFGRDAAEQAIIVHENERPSPNTWASWSAAIMIGELYAGDGFYEPEEASQIVNKCIFRVFYGNTKVTQEVLRSEPYSLDGHDGWIMVTNLSFSIPNLPTTNELATVIIIQTSQMSSSIFYSSIPGDTPQFNADVDYAIAGLQVDP